MEFKKNQTIYLQIADLVSEKILTGLWPVDEKIASIREMAAMIEVNPNTIMRTYTYLTEKGIIYNKRGVGFFVATEAPKMINKIEKDLFVKTELPELFKKMELLNIEFSEVEKLYKRYSKN